MLIIKLYPIIVPLLDADGALLLSFEYHLTLNMCIIIAFIIGFYICLHLCSPTLYNNDDKIT